jgi:hypothetical protein
MKAAAREVLSELSATAKLPIRSNAPARICLTYLITLNFLAYSNVTFFEIRQEGWNSHSSCFVEPKALITLLHDLAARVGTASDEHN